MSVVVDLDGDVEVDAAAQTPAAMPIVPIRRPGQPRSGTSRKVPAAGLEADSANRHKIARGEAMECAASLDVLKLRKLITEERYQRGTHDLEAVVAMLTKMI